MSPRGANNRTDLALPKTAAPKQPYGDAKAQIDAQSAIPMAPSPSAPAAPAQARAAASGPPPGSLPYMHPTNRPEEPVTAGMDFGPGPGSETMAAPRLSLTQELGNATQSSGLLSDLAGTARSMGM
jgi:hypothetical protein